MQDLLMTPEKRSKLITLGLARSKEFSWQKTALQTLDSYKTAVGGFVGNFGS